MHPEVQEEIVTAINNEVKGEVTYENLKRIKIVDAAIKESQRLYNSNPLNARECDAVTGGCFSFYPFFTGCGRGENDHGHEASRSR